MYIIYRLYNIILWLLTPALLALVQLRRGKGKEHDSRYRERFGITSIKRPTGKVIWLHGASIGETLSVLPLIALIKEKNSNINILITSGTVTSAKLINERLGDSVIHQFIPLDHPLFRRRFLQHWQPQAIYWVESDLWVGILHDIKKMRIPAFLINARMSERSYKSWRQFPAIIRDVLSAFQLIFTSNNTYKQRFTDLSNHDVQTISDLKYDSAINNYPVDTVNALKKSIQGRPFWMAASTHDPEEETILQVHKKILETIPNACLLLAPRHPNRRDVIVKYINKHNLTFTVRSKGEHPTQEVYLADTMGEMDLFYANSQIVFIGGSLINHGGQNPFEAARHGCVILHGQHMHNFPTMCRDLADALLMVNNENDLYTMVHKLLTDNDLLAQQKNISINNCQSLSGASNIIYQQTKKLWL